jgi:hypothetical protein
MAPTNAVSLAFIVERLALAEEGWSPFPLTPGAEGSQGSADHSTTADSPFALPRPGSRV